MEPSASDTLNHQLLLNLLEIILIYTFTFSLFDLIGGIVFTLFLAALPVLFPFCKALCNIVNKSAV